ncbi:hypothetical protein BDD12DRAFT_882271 [Trichophaea hybrida]|nr:hypothetical protein BDD12DRAFT_882271 [Trichophaea hybrida]
MAYVSVWMVEKKELDRYIDIPVALCDHNVYQALYQVARATSHNVDDALANLQNPDDTRVQQLAESSSDIDSSTLPVVKPITYDPVEAASILKEHGINLGDNILWHTSSIVSDLPKPDLLHTMQLGMLKHLLGWLQQLMKKFKQLTKYHEPWLSVPAYLTMTKPKILYEEVSQWTGKTLGTMSHYLLAVVTNALRCPNASDIPTSDDAIQSLLQIQLSAWLPPTYAHNAPTAKVAYAGKYGAYVGGNVILMDDAPGLESVKLLGSVAIDIHQDTNPSMSFTQLEALSLTPPGEWQRNGGSAPTKVDSDDFEIRWKRPEWEYYFNRDNDGKTYTDLPSPLRQKIIKSIWAALNNLILRENGANNTPAIATKPRQVVLNKTAMEALMMEPNIETPIISAIRIPIVKNYDRSRAKQYRGLQLDDDQVENEGVVDKDVDEDVDEDKDKDKYKDVESESVDDCKGESSVQDVLQAGCDV